MKAPPSFFEKVRSNAENRWRQLEADPELAGPWHRLFQQVQSPRHVLSELLQNADDADATWASASIDGGKFVFSHNGRDFTADEFGSLCRFGYSNKRALHTIGFRGVGFKSAFSLGDEIRVSSPGLSVAFRKNRFTEPIWIGEDASEGQTTTISVELRDAGVQKQLTANLSEWLSSPASLLFFRSIRSLQVGETELRWNEEGPGPVPGSQWLTLSNSETKPVLFVRSEPEPFPEDALAEIEAERILGEGEHLNLPPCTVEILLGEEKRLFVVLPTGVTTPLPFAINAPFVQDTARLKVKDPDTSPTNKWLLQRAGRLAAEAMLAWLSQDDDDARRAAAYDLMPDVDREATSLEGSSAAVVELSFAEAVEDRSFVMVEGGGLVGHGNAVSLPAGILDVWTLTETARLFTSEDRQIASRYLSSSAQSKLQNWKSVLSCTRTEVIDRLEDANPRKPQSWNQLLRLWSYLADDIPTSHWYGDINGIRVAPIQGDNDLYSAKSLVRLGEKKLLTSDSDWTFLSDHLRVLNPNWVRYLAEQRKLAEQRDDAELRDHVERAYRLMDHLDLEDASDMNLVMKRVATSFYTQESYSRAHCVRIAQIAARFGAATGPDFKFVTRDSRLRPASSGIVADESGRVGDIVPDSWSDEHILHGDYWTEWTSCSREEWVEWVASGRSELLTAPPITAQKQSHWSRKALDADLKDRGFEGSYDPHYKTEFFELHDFDFEKTLWNHWRSLADQGKPAWTLILGLILRLRPAYWSKLLTARVQHVATTGSRRQIAEEGISTSWILKFRELPCLLDTRGVARKPFEVLRRTAQTEALLEVEPFLLAEVDTEANRPLFDALRVRNTPSGPEQVLQRIQALAEAEHPPLDELDKWYCKLDSLMTSCSTSDALAVKEAFASQPLIYSAEHGWLKSGEVFLSTSEDDMQDAPVIRTSVRDLELWRRIDVADRPNFSLVLAWLEELPVGEQLTPDVAKRTKSALARFPDAIWDSAGHWLNIAGQWVPTNQLEYSLSLRTLTKSQDLFPAIRQATADFQMLSHEQQDRPPFFSIPSLASCIEERIPDQSAQRFEPTKKPWLECLAKNLARIEVPSELEQARLRDAAVRLAKTQWLQGTSLETVPYIDGVPIGPARRVPVVWSDCTLYVADAPIPLLAAPVAREIARGFDHAGIGDAVKFCFERDPQFILDYLEQEFTLSTSPVEIPVEEPKAEEPVAEAPNVQGKTVTLGPTASDPVLDDQQEAPRADSPTSEPQDSQLSGSGQSPQNRESHRTEKPSLLERFAAANGLRSDGNGRFLGSDGTVLLKTHDNVFPWELRLPGREAQFLMPFDHCLERESVVLDAEVWGLLRSSESQYVLLLVSPDSTPILRTGAELAKDIEERRIALFPAKYRLSSVR